MPREPQPVTTYFTAGEIDDLQRLAALGYGERQLCTVVQYLVARELDDLRRAGVLGQGQSLPPIALGGPVKSV